MHHFIQISKITLHLSFISCILSPSAFAADLNFKAFELLKKGEPEKAKPIMEQAIVKDPKNPYAQLNMARIISMIQGKKQPEEYCDLPSNWIFLALSHLTNALEIKRDAVLEKIKNDNEFLINLKSYPEYTKWWKAVNAPSSSSADETIRLFIKEQGDWVSTSGVPRLLKFTDSVNVGAAAADSLDLLGDSWDVKDGKVQVLKDGKVKAVYEVRRDLFFYDEGRRSIYKLYLVPKPEDGLRWEIGPISADCGIF